MGRTTHKKHTGKRGSQPSADDSRRKRGQGRTSGAAPADRMAYATCTGVRNAPPRLSLTIPPDRLDAATWEQIESALALPCMVHLAIMPDAHAGYDLCIGGVALLDGHISPSFVGYDIGCGMCHVNTGLPVDEVLPDEAARQLLFDRLRLAIPVGTATRAPGEYDLTRFISASGDTQLTDAVNARQSIQLATLGGGNHFLEVGVNKRGEIGVTVHSGSRRSGWDIGAWYMKQGRLFPLDSRLGRAYRQDMDWALDYALLNRRLMLEHALRALADVHRQPARPAHKRPARPAAPMAANGATDLKGHTIHPHAPTSPAPAASTASPGSISPTSPLSSLASTATPIPSAHPPLSEQEISLLLGRMINENHNHAVVLNRLGPSGAPLVLHRKGATPADAGQPGIIPANQRDGVYVTEGLGNEEYLSSASHGAGRRMSRNEAHRTIPLERFRSQMRGIVCRADKGVLDEAPDAYKPIAEVLAAQDGILVRIIDHFRPLVVLKG
ncbi:RtcB family protein [Nitratidesulfovibrio sp. SRB-5]|uniref:RtcB family protein n=1 Tax=Nitratidesulfovibrio sp. SRB-5 TaxID=2872636 RepID=UPI001024ADE8|nr:RtcB family protein [Nitratidesulfovibrio sp. SRB-5]MBZ2171072.1 RtcB family protein [Nitratidesulfovibrio sp. SRB-5]RXF76165.1 RtcB family protein [Desulfovibrio sp. DS-1]